MDAYVQARGADAAIAALAGRQHGVVSRVQLEAIGLARGAIGWRLEHGRLHHVHRGVYAVGHRVLSPRGTWMAAVLAVGDDAVLSHRSAAALWGIRPTSGSRVEVTAPRGVRSRAGLRAHQAPLGPDEVTTRDGIPVTTPPRTLLDLAAVVPPHHLERALNEAERQHLADSLSLDSLLHRHPTRAGRAALRRALERAQRGAGITRSELEDRFLAFLDLHALERPATNVPIALQGATVEADCLWRRHRLVVELDGYATHATRAAFERDRARDRRLQAAGWRVVRITWRQLHEEPREVAAELRALLVTGRAAPAAARPAPSR
jgi:predicted transcriptional regulator of viral defense system